jgi:hypothetical protein
MKKSILFTLVMVVLFSFALTGCRKAPLMDEPGKDGKYHYQNNDLGFSLVLPEEFIYYQTQRKSGDGFIDVEVFIPSSDLEQQIDVPGYAKPMFVRIYEKDAYQAENGLQKIGENDEKIYAVGFWSDVPSDWEEKWDEKLKNFLINNINIK